MHFNLSSMVSLLVWLKYSPTSAQFLIRGSYVKSIAFDDKGNIDIITTFGLGAGTPAAGAGFTFTYTKADNK